MKQETELCKMAYKYKTDKCKKIKHPYTPFYYHFLKDKREDIKKILELGIGSKNGASLRMWKEFFPNATIYGIDNKKERLIQDDRIESFLCDGTNKEEIEELIKNIGFDIDLFIDDGSHRYKDQIETCRILKPLIKNAIFIIEDVRFPDTIRRRLPKYSFMSPELYDTKYFDDRILVVT